MARVVVIAEGYGLWIVDRQGFIGEPPAIDGMQPTDNLDAYVEQKIFTLNTAHAIIGYLGYLKGYEFIHEALQDAEISQVVSGAMEESGLALIQRHNLNPEQQAQYVANTLKRFANAALPDPIVRVAREPKRKLAPNDRLIKPALLAIEAGITPVNLATGIAAALLYDNSEDLQSIELAKAIRAKGLDTVLDEICSIKPSSMLAGLIREKVNELTSDRSS